MSVFSRALSHLFTLHSPWKKIPFCCTGAGICSTAANIIKLCGLSLCGVEMKAYRAEFFSGSLQLLSACKVFTALELFHFIITLKLPPSKADQQQQRWQQKHSRPCHPCTAGGSFEAVESYTFCLGKDLCLYKPQVQCVFLKPPQSKEGRATNTQPPLG